MDFNVESKYAHMIPDDFHINILFKENSTHIFINSNSSQLQAKNNGIEALHLCERNQHS